MDKLAEYARNPSRILDRASRFHTIQTSDLAWIFGVGRSGSTWITELLDGLYATRVWHEPYFGSLLQHPSSLPSEFDREDSFFSHAYEEAWIQGLRYLLLTNVRARFGRISKRTKIIVKDINSPQLCPHFASIFPDSKYLLLVRDPYDILDSHMDMRIPGSWNEQATTQHTAAEFAEHIRQTMERAIEGYRNVSEDKRLMIQYGDVLRDPVAQVSRCASFLGLPFTELEVEKTVAEHRFEIHKQTGQGAFRRFGKAGIWKESGNFTPEVVAVAENYLGELRTQLGYGPIML